MEKELNKISLYQEGGAVNKTVNDVPLQELSAEVQQRIEAGEEPAQILASYLQEGIEPDQLNIVFEEAGYDPSKFADLLLGAEQIKVAQEQSMQAEQPGQIPGNVAEGQSANPQQELLEQLENVDVPQANVGFETTARGPIDRQPNQGYRPIYSTPSPKKNSLINAAYMLNDFVGEMENSFDDWDGKQARYKQKQLANKSYEVDFGNNDVKNYAVNLEDLNNGVVKTYQEKEKDLLKYSKFDFNPELNKFTGNVASSQLELDAIPKNQRLKYGQTIADITSGIKEYGEDNAFMVANALKNESGVYGKDAVLSYDDNGNPISKSLEGLTEEEKAIHRGRYRDMVTGQQGAQKAPSFSPYIYKGPTDAPLTTAAANQPSMMRVPNSSKSVVANQPSFKEWYATNSTSPMLQGKSQNDLMLMYDNAEFKYGGAPLPKAQFNIPDWMYGNPVGPMGPTPLQQEQQNFQIPNNMGEFLQSALTTDYNRDTQAVKDSQLQQSVANPLKVNTPLTAADEPAADNTSAQPTVKRKRSIGNAIDQAETFIKDSPVMNAVGDISKGVVMGANLLTAMTDPNDQINDLRSQTNADKVYAVTDVPNAQGNFDVNSGLQEQNKLVDYYSGMAMYGKEIYKAGGEFEPHIMFDPKTGNAYKANKPVDHERFAKMGFVHQDKMQNGGSVTPEMKAYSEALAFHKEARQAIGTNDTEKLKKLGLAKAYNTNDLARDFSELQKLRQAAGLGLAEEASITFPHVGQQIRGGFNSMFGTNFEQGGEIEVDNDTLAALIAAGADIEML